MTLKLASGFELAKFSDLNHEGMAIEIRYKGTPIAELNRDKGRYAQDIEIPSRFSPIGEKFIFPLDDFISALNEARKLLISLE